MELGERIATLREEQALTQTELAEAARISPSTLSQIESGRVPRPHVGTVRKIARALGIEPAELRRTEELVLPKAEAPGLVDRLRAQSIPIEELSDQERREIERVLAGEKPRAYFVEEPVFGEAIATAAEEWLRTVSDPGTERPMAYGITKAAQDLESFITQRLGEPGWWENLSGEDKRSIARVSKLLGDIADEYLTRVEAQSEQLAEDQEARRRRDEMRKRTQRISA